MAARPQHIAIAIATRAIVILLVLAVSVGVYIWLAATRPEPVRTEEDADRPRVLVMRPQFKDVHRQWQGYGTTRAMRTSDVPARVTATVTRVPDEILEGVTVHRGQLLVELDASDFLRQLEIAHHAIASIEAQLQQLESELRAWTDRLELADDALQLVQREYDRVQTAYEAGAAKERELDQARAALINARRDQVGAQEAVDAIGPRRAALNAQLEGQRSQRRLAEENVSRSRILAPIDGVLTTVDVDEGENVTAGQRIARIVNLDRLEIPLRLPASARATIAVGDEVVIRSTSLDVAPVTASIERVSPDDDEHTQTLTAYIVLDRSERPGTWPAPGEFVSGRVQGAAVRDRHIVPRRAVRNSRVTVVRENQIDTVDVQPLFSIEDTFTSMGVDDTQWLVLEEPLPADVLVVLDGSRRFIAGARVDPVLAVEQLAGDRQP